MTGICYLSMYTRIANAQFGHDVYKLEWKAQQEKMTAHASR